MNKAMKKLRHEMAKEKWYGSKEHFRTEKSYEEHLEEKEKKREKHREHERSESKEYEKHEHYDPIGMKEYLRRNGF